MGNMKIFCSYAHRGENITDLTRRMQAIKDVLAELGHESYCNLFDPDLPGFNDDAGLILRDVVGGKLKRYDVVYVITTSERCSEGIAMEVGAALALGKPIYLAQHRSAAGTQTIDALAEAQFVWESEDELLARTRELFSAGAK